ncbi:MAG: undecaprenyl-diphosphate phosphatase [Kiritimatiellia bacterium]
MREFLDVTLLAVLQGVAEFLPVSSSGHLVILQHVLEVPAEMRFRLEIFLHAGTLLSIFVFYARRLATTVNGMIRGCRSDWAYAGKIVVSAVPAIVVYGLFRRQIEDLVTNVQMVGALLMFTGAVLIGTRYLPRGERAVGVWRALAMGLGQALALLPGVSRSGMTLASARASRVSPEAAAEFSFLMSTPLIVGGIVLELLKGDIAIGGSGSAGMLLWGMVSAAVVGYFSLALLVKTLKSRGFWLFGPYCVVAGLLTVCFCR